MIQTVVKKPAMVERDSFHDKHDKVEAQKALSQLVIPAVPLEFYAYFHQFILMPAMFYCDLAARKPTSATKRIIPWWQLY
ncbi:MAG: hypothetical protein PHZ25_04255 [Candidatus Pacebacteria bacterium]|nr:hypothetical protein [Candidatus Paceibacterota bacterium]